MYFQLCDWGLVSCYLEAISPPGLQVHTCHYNPFGHLQLSKQAVGERPTVSPAQNGCQQQTNCAASARVLPPSWSSPRCPAARSSLQPARRRPPPRDRAPPHHLRHQQHHHRLRGACHDGCRQKAAFTPRPRWAECNHSTLGLHRINEAAARPRTPPPGPASTTRPCSSSPCQPLCWPRCSYRAPARQPAHCTLRWPGCWRHTRNVVPVSGAPLHCTLHCTATCSADYSAHYSAQCSVQCTAQCSVQCSAQCTAYSRAGSSSQGRAGESSWRGALLTTAGVQCALCTVKCALCTVKCAMCMIKCALCTVHCALSSVHCALCTVKCALCNVKCEVCSLQCTVCTS